MNVGRLSSSQIAALAGASGGVSSKTLTALKLSAPQQKAVDYLVKSFETKIGSSPPSPAQFQSLITQISALLMPSQRQQLQALLKGASGGQPAAVVTGASAALSEFDLINGSKPSGSAGSLRLFDYLGDGSSTPASSDPRITGSLWNFGSRGSAVRNALI